MRGVYLVMEPTALVHPRSVGLRFAADWACFVTGHVVGLVPTLLGSFQTPHQRLCYYRPADVYGDVSLHGRRGCGSECQSWHGAERIPVTPRCACHAAVARSDDAVCVQAAGDDPAWAAQAASAAAEVASRIYINIGSDNRFPHEENYSRFTAGAKARSPRRPRH